MAVFTLTSCTALLGTTWTGTAPGDPGTQTASGTITSTTDISAMLYSVDIAIAADEQDFTNFASGGWRVKRSGLKAGTLQLNFYQDFAAGQVDALFGLSGSLMPIGGNGTYYIDLKPTSSARGTTNPSTVAQLIPAGSYSPISGAVGDKAIVSLQIPTTGLVARLTS